MGKSFLHAIVVVRFETHLAHTRMLDSSENNLIVVFKERVDIKDENLKLLVRSWKCLHLNDDNGRAEKKFWDRLRAEILRKDISNSFKIPFSFIASDFK